MAPRLPDADQAALLRLVGRGISRFPPKKLLHMPGSSTTLGRPDARADASDHVAFRLRNSVGAQDAIFTRLNGWPMHSPTDASLSPLQTTAHGSGPMRIATPSSCRTCTDYSLPVSPAHCERFPTSSDINELARNGFIRPGAATGPVGTAQPGTQQMQARTPLVFVACIRLRRGG